jgi:tryptophan synthase alpha chain
MRAVAADSRGFLYAISRAGVTGARDDLPRELPDQIRAIRAAASGLPIAVGFGISRREQIAALGGLVDGVVVGSALVRVIEEAGGAPDLPRRIEEFCEALLR